MAWLWGLCPKRSPSEVLRQSYTSIASRQLHRMGLELDIPWTNYYDDFPVVDFKILSGHTGAAARALTSMLGFECSLDKELPFDRSADMLGVVLDLSEFTEVL